MGFIDLFIKPEPQEQKKGGQTKPSSAPTNNAASSHQQSAPRSTDTNAQQTANTTTAPSSENVSLPVDYAIESSSEISMDVQKKLWQTLQDRNIPGPDIMEMITYSASLESLGLPTEKRYEAAFNVLKSQYPTFNKKTVLNSADVYISYVKEELESGKRQFAEKRRHDVDAKRQEVSNLINNRTLLMAQIEDLKKRCDMLTQRIEETQGAADKSDKEIAHNEQVFENTVNAMIKRIEEDKEVMSKLNIN